MTIYGIKNCDSVRKAMKFLRAKEIAFDFVDFKTTPVERAKIDQWLEQSPIEKLFNTRGTTYRTLNLKALALDAQGKAEWLGKENMLIKRPVIEYKDQVIVGFNEAQYEEIFI
ncbi:MAG: arsenate reductase family protein [Epsilonproteobacteria bacterium]|nr:arsenate reductase family protein [Campylobacterota bacterium]